MVPVPKLLVSIRSLDEARIALTAGVAILDIKEPNNGSLGASTAETMQQVCEFVRSTGNVPVSAALGELHEHPATPVAIPESMNYLKMGLTSSVANQSSSQGIKDWKATWRDIRALYRESHPETKWIAVAYVDQPKSAPSVDQTIQFAIEEGCAGVLLDTYYKDGRSLTSWRTIPEIEAMVREVQSSGLEMALAGSLNLDDVERLSKTSADILAVRSLACKGSQRNGTISASAIQEIQSLL